MVASINDPLGIGSELVERLIGLTAYEIVRTVAANLTQIATLAPLAEEIPALSAVADEIALIAPHLEALELVAADVEGIAGLVTSAANALAQAQAAITGTADDRTHTAQDRVQTGLDRVQTALDRIATAADVVQTGADRTQTGADRATTAANVGLSQTSATTAQAALSAVQALVAAGSIPIFATTADALSNGVIANGAITPGNSGTNGTFTGTVTGGAGTGAAFNFVVAGGALIQIVWLSAGRGYTSAPVLGFTASGGLTAASATSVIGPNTVDGQYFAVVDVVNGGYNLYKNVAGAAVFQFSTGFTQGLVNAATTTVAGPIAPLVAGAGVAFDTTYFWPSSQKTYDQILTLIEAGTGGGVCTGDIVVAMVNGTKLDLVGTPWPFSFTPSAISVNPMSVVTPFLVPAGCVVGFYVRTGQFCLQAGAIPNGESMWTTSGTPAVNMTKTVVTVDGIRGRFTLKGLSAYNDAVTPVMKSLLGALQTIGWPSVVSGGTSTGNPYTAVLHNPVEGDGAIVRLRIGSGVGGPATISIVTMNPVTNQIATIVSQKVVSLLPNDVSYLELDIPVTKGQRVAISGPLRYAGSNPLGLSSWAQNGTATVGVTMLLGQFRFEVAFDVESGVTLAATRATRQSTSNGMSLFATADATGVVDATAIFAAARVAHPFPYVPAGTYSVTSLPAGGDGFWGPGVIMVNNVRFFIPTSPETGNLLDRGRAALMDVVATNGVLCLLADSIGTNSYAPTGPQHHFNLVTGFFNAGIAKDEPGLGMMVPYAPGNYDPAFYGVTIGGSYTQGTLGPTATSLVLAAGAYIEFTGAYEQVDVFWKQVAGMGNVEFKYNGAAYKTVDNSAVSTTELDHYSGPSPTGQTVSGTFRVTAIGASVELTGLIRLGVIAAVTGTNKRRLRTMRATMGNYRFSNFTAAAVASACKQATYAGGVITPIIALMINDSFALSLAQITTDVNNMIDRLQAGGAPRILGVINHRPSSGWNGQYSGGRTYEAAAGLVRQIYRSRGVIIIPNDAIDWDNEGLLQDGLHPGLLGQGRYAQSVIETICRKG